MGGRVEDGWLPMANPDAKEPTGWMVDRRLGCDTLEEYAPGWPASMTAAGSTSEWISASGEGLM
jgi:hypothetical protein